MMITGIKGGDAMVSMENSKQELMNEIRILKNRIAEFETGGTQSPSPDSSEAMTDFSGNETILVVDDTEAVRDFAATLLQQNGYRVLQASDGESALTVYKSHTGPIHLILSDVVMPDFSGLEVVKRLQPLREETRVLFMSGYNTEQIIHDDVSIIIALGANYIPKPLSSKSLLRVIRILLDNEKNC